MTGALGHPLTRGLIATMGAAGVALAGYARFVEQRQLRLAWRRVPVPGLPPEFAGLRVLHLSDLHVGAPHCGARHVAAAGAALPADLVLVTGDLVHGTRHIGRCADLLAAISAPLGIWVSLGNHDYSYPNCKVDTGRLIATLEARGLRVLRNSAAPVEWRGSTLWLAGVDDPHRRKHDVRAALAGVPSDACTLLLAHSPDVLPDVPPGRVALVLAGHTHGGQVRFPRLPALVTRTRLRFREPHGVRRVGGQIVHFHAGLGSPTPYRFRMPPEAAVLELVPAHRAVKYQMARASARSL
ncbi:MAG TPA: metallophosphoesterase [Chloroflexota bacterium]|nr:metallophosphoesterase [Chloroflexota bacterium]